MEENEIDLEKLDLNTVAVCQIPPVLVELFINKKNALMEVDTGASCSVMSLNKFKEVGQLQELKESSVRLRTYTSELVKPYGTTVVEVSHERTKNSLPLLVMKGNVPTLLGQIKAGVEKELDCLENQEIFKRMEYSWWAPPNVPVVKNDNGDI